MLPAPFSNLEFQPRTSGAVTILRLLAASSPNWPEVALVVARDPALSLALLLAQPLAGGELADGLNSILRRRLERIGTDLLRAWLLGLGHSNAHGGASPDLALLRAECALHLAIETHYARPDEAYLAGLWRGFEQAREPGDATPSAKHVRNARSLSALVRDCGLPASLGDALELGPVLEEQLTGAHPLLSIVVAAERLAAPQWQEHLPETARLSGLSEGVLTSMRTDVAYIVSGHAAYPASPPLPPGAEARLPAAVIDDPYRSAGMLGLLTAAFVDLDPEQVEDRLAIACPLFGLHAVPTLLAEDGEGRLRPMLPAQEGTVPALIDELHLRLDDDTSVIALCARSEHATDFALHGNRIGRSLIDWQAARWLGYKGFCCLPLTSNGQAVVALIGVNHAGELGSELRWRYAALLGAAVRSLRAALHQRKEIATREAALHQRFRDHVRKIVHEAANPLTVIKSRLEMLGIQRPEDAPLQDEMVQLNAELDRIDNLLRTAGDLPRETVEVPHCRVPELLLDMRSIYGDTLFSERGIQLELRAAKKLPPAAIPASALKQVLLNLFRNASEALLPGERLVVSVSSQVTVDGRASLEIRLVDNGPGLPPERAVDLFSPRASKKGGDHQGVGLAVVREILSQWGATILCRSQPGSGTSFQIFLPLEESA
ncbi:sensor histidine kinase [Thauera linaloolentis]|uniref:histidine kinase n=1 Tax=Thauera linaloolentis (strain DSM 12138 / JCM 21573 / CCUG 41526 / CIP 105981 / IAM 15112 / NBRC 102519 / 47Lol) TaxID=1123367 RepID=N6Z470_THAL4|nr:HAMP domain-containing sensor histidine kinase [Thauera linaloolentis]ENO89372.1 histidine kinase [Thauera linaloolentis 47Lol = DSM 12138]MCM8564404.1 HAMP domain-containing histidine kinase [Thauera linaloolentis]